MLTVDYAASACRPANACSTSGAGSAATPTRRPARRVGRLVRSRRGRARRRAIDRRRDGAKTTRSPMASASSPSTATPPRCRFPTTSFERVIASEVVEHIPDDGARVRRAGTRAQARRHVGRHGPGMARRAHLLGSVRRLPGTQRTRRPRAHLLRAPTLREQLRDARSQPAAAHHAHALHSPYWWLRCAVGLRQPIEPTARRRAITACCAGTSRSNRASLEVARSRAQSDHRQEHRHLRAQARSSARSLSSHGAPAVARRARHQGRRRCHRLSCPVSSVRPSSPAPSTPSRSGKSRRA